MPSKLTIRVKLVIILALVAIVSSGISAHLAYDSASQALEEQSFHQLTAVRELKASQVEDYFQGIVDQIITFSESHMIVEAARRFRSAFQDIEGDLALSDQEREAGDLRLRLYYQDEFLPRLNANLPSQASLSDYWPTDLKTRLVQHLYISANPFETGGKHLLDLSEDGSSYSRVHGLYHPVIRHFLERFGYYDIFIIDPDTGHIVYSVFKEVDFGTSLLTGPYSESNIAGAFLAARDNIGKNFVRLVDFEPYPPSYGGEASFISSPVYDEEEVVGVLVFQMPVNRINDIMTSRQEWSRVGLGESGETYIVGQDFTLRNQSRFLIEDKENYLRAIERAGTPGTTVSLISSLNNSIGLQEVRTEGTQAALAGETGTRTFPDYRGVSVLSAFRPLDIQDMKWAVMSEIDADEALKPARDLRRKILLSQLVLVIVFLFLAVFFSRTLTQPLKRLSLAASRLARGEMEAEVETARQDEIGELSRSFEVMRQSLRRLLRKQSDAIDALSVPLIPLHQDIVVVPLVGELDVHRVAKFRTELIEGLHSAEKQVAIIDVTGVPQMDQEVAQGLIRAAQSARLLGAQVVLTGIQPETAERLTDLDLHFEGLVTERSLQSGIEWAMRRLEAGTD